MTFHHATLCKAHDAMIVRVGFWGGDAMEHNTVYTHILFWKLVHVFFPSNSKLVHISLSFKFCN